MASPYPIDPPLQAIRDALLAAGFDRAGIAPVALPHLSDELDAWFEAGYSASMGWLERHREVRLDLRERFEWARSVMVLTRRYPHRPGDSGLAPFVSTYAQGADYHDVLLARLQGVAKDVEAVHPDFRWHAYVDTGPALERQLAEAAGLGWRAKNSLLLDARDGSRFFLALLISNAAWEPDPQPTASCGNCDACQVACPTDAFVSPGVVDARRCISYLTIEHRGVIDEELRPAMGQWLFGCDLCQSCCPFEFRSQLEGDVEFSPDDPVLSTTLAELLSLDDAQFHERFRGTPLARPKREGLLRNACIVVANGKHLDCVPAVRALLTDSSPVLREVASWCLERLDKDSPGLS
jgi:epoxyqueuosine reductase